MSPEDLLLVDAASAIHAGTLSPLAYAHALLARIDRVEADVRAWTTVDRETVLAEAAQCEEEARRRQFRGPLHGIPIGVKDIFYTKGLRTTMGSPRFATFVPDRDAHAVAKLRQAGAIVMGKTVTTVFAYLDPGPTRNPWNLAHTPGGSSSGSAAAVAARMCPASIGSQTVGSVGRPGAFNGIVSLVPGQARIRLDSVFPLAWSLDHVGTFGRSVADVELMLETLTESPVPQVPAKQNIRIGMIRDFFYTHASAEAQTGTDALAHKLADAGFVVEEIGLPPIFSAGTAILRTIIRAEASAAHGSQYSSNSELYSPKLRELIETGSLVSATDYLRARQLRRQYQCGMARLFEKVDILLTPAAKGTAPEGIHTTGEAVMNGPWTLADFPVLTLPFALGANGLPLGVQLAGPPMQEGLLLMAAKAIEAVIGFNQRPSL